MRRVYGDTFSSSALHTLSLTQSSLRASSNNYIVWTIVRYYSYLMIPNINLSLTCFSVNGVTYNMGEWTGLVPSRLPTFFAWCRYSMCVRSLNCRSYLIHKLFCSFTFLPVVKDTLDYCYFLFNFVGPLDRLIMSINMYISGYFEKYLNKVLVKSYESYQIISLNVWSISSFITIRIRIIYLCVFFLSRYLYIS